MCSDDALWLIPSIVEYIKETGEMSLLDEVVTYADGGEGTVYEHMTRILDFSAEQVGATGIYEGLRADWNDCLNLGGGESAMVSFLHYWAIQNFLEVAEQSGKTADIEKIPRHGGKGARRLRRRAVGRQMVYPRHHGFGAQDRHPAGYRGQGAYGVQHLGGHLRRGG